MGQVRGFAEFANRFTAEVRVEASWKGEICRMRFCRSEEDAAKLKIEEIGGCRSFHGMGVSFEGTFIRERENLFDLGFMNELELQHLFAITGQYYRPMMLRFGGTGKTEWLDKEIWGEEFFGIVRGLAPIMAAIVMRGE